MPLNPLIKFTTADLEAEIKRRRFLELDNSASRKIDLVSVSQLYRIKERLYAMIQGAAGGMLYDQYGKEVELTADLFQGLGKQFLNLSDEQAARLKWAVGKHWNIYIDMPLVFGLEDMAQKLWNFGAR